jgi:hypothetical protein
MPHKDCTIVLLTKNTTTIRNIWGIKKKPLHLSNIMKKEQKVVASAFATRHHYKDIIARPLQQWNWMKSTPMDINML